MNNAEADHIVTKTMEKCWHEAIPDIVYPTQPPKYKCAFCGEYFSGKNPSPSTSWEDYGKVLEWVQKQEWWGVNFLINYTLFFVQNVEVEDVVISLDILLNPEEGTLALARFIVENSAIIKEGK